MHKSKFTGKPVSRSFRLGYRQGFNRGFDMAFDRGYERGMADERSSGLRAFSGTSIIIPTWNQLAFLKQCLESIRLQTPEPHEVIVVDNASGDGTADYLRSLKGQVRFRINRENSGFAGAANQGLMMAGGTTLLILNNDTVVTPNWLSNLLRCVDSDPAAGLVGPVSNNISGDQQIAVPYHTLEGMQRFARAYNVSDPGKWLDTKRLTGFCLMMRRDVFARLGYFDESFEIGNCEDDDYGMRARLLGLKLIIAADTFIHHFGSVSMKALGQQFEQIYGQSLQTFSEKWGDLGALWPDSALIGSQPGPAMTDFYPDRVVVAGGRGDVYWVENGVRHPLQGGGRPATHLSRVDLRNWPLGSPIFVERTGESVAPANGFPGNEGGLLRSPDGRFYRLQNERVRPVVSEKALRSWHFEQSPSTPVTHEQLASYPVGLPIVAPILIKEQNL